MMGTGIKESLSDLVKKSTELYKELVTTNVKFDSLRVFTKETIDEFKRLLERQGDKLDQIERERIRAETELLSKINALDARLNALSEKALHAAMEQTGCVSAWNKDPIIGVIGVQAGPQ
jgi:hypothetical protein